MPFENEIRVQSFKEGERKADITVTLENAERLIFLEIRFLL